MDKGYSIYVHAGVSKYYRLRESQKAKYPLLRVEGVFADYGVPDYEKRIVRFSIVRYESFQTGFAGTAISADEYRTWETENTWKTVHGEIGAIELPLADEDMPPEFGGISVKGRFVQPTIARVFPIVIIPKVRAVAEWDEGLHCWMPTRISTWSGKNKLVPTDEQRKMLAFQHLFLEEE